MPRRITVRAIIYSDKKLLGVQLKPYRGSIQMREPYWCTPGGGVDERESLKTALKREIIEETGIEPEIGKLLYIQQFKQEENEQLEFFFCVNNPENFRKIDISKTSHGVTEIEKIEFIDPATSNLLPVFLTESDIQSDIDNSSDTKIFNYL